MSNNRSQGWLEIKEGLRLDACGQDAEAFTKYLEGVQKLCTHIKDENTLEELQRNASSRASVLKVLGTMKESLTRVANIVSKTVVHDVQNQVQETVFSSNLSMSLPTTIPSSKSAQNIRPMTLEMENAQKQNHHLLRHFQNRWSKVKDPAMRVTLSLELQRRIQENLAVAREKASKYRQEQIKKEAEALQLAAKKLASSCVLNEMAGDPQSWNGKVALCACVLRYKLEDNWIPAFTKQFRENQSETLVKAAMCKILKNANHPLTIWLYGKRENLRDKLSSIHSQQLSHDNKMSEFMQGKVDSNAPDLLSMFDPVTNLSENAAEPRSALKDAAQEAGCVLETYLQIFGVALDLTEFSDQVDACYPILEETFYHDLWPLLIQVYRHVYKEEESVLSTVCQRFKGGTDSDVNISELLSLPAQKLDVIFVDLQQFLSQHSPLAKVHSLVQITHVLCENDKTLKYEKILSADDLIGLVSCLLVQSNMPHLYAEFEALEHFIPHRFLLGEEGYSLTTFLTAVRYLESQGETSKQNSANSC